MQLVFVNSRPTGEDDIRAASGPPRLDDRDGRFAGHDELLDHGPERHEPGRPLPRPGDGPVDQAYVGPSRTGVCAPGASNTATLPTSGLTAGDDVVYFLYNDGCTRPATLELAGSGTPRSPTSAFTLRNVEVGAPPPRP
jgi:hypothetical protein